MKVFVLDYPKGVRVFESLEKALESLMQYIEDYQIEFDLEDFIQDFNIDGIAYREEDGSNFLFTVCKVE